MKIFRKFKFSIASVLLLTAIVGFITSLVASRRAQIMKEAQIFEALLESDIEVKQIKPTPNFAEKVLGVQLQPSEYKVRLRYDQNRHLYELTKLTGLKELTIMLNDNLPNLMIFSDFDNLEKLWVNEWYRPESMDGVQSLSNLKYLEIGNVETPEKIDLTALADHPTLEEFRIGAYPLDKSKNFQVLPNW